MNDIYGRNVHYLRLSVTELCNLRCRYCMPEEGICKKRHEEMLTEDEMVQAVEIFCSLGIDKVRITGGEPLVKKNIVSICSRIARIPQVKDLCLTTNGLLLPQLAKPLRKEQTVGGQTQLLHLGDPGNAGADGDDILFDQGLSAGDAHLVDAEAAENLHCLDHLVLREHLLVALLADALLWHTVPAPKIT